MIEVDCGKGVAFQQRLRKDHSVHGATIEARKPNCPSCASVKVWRDGHRPAMFGDPIQRWSCRDCGYKFSDPNDVERAKRAFREAQTPDSKMLKGGGGISSARQICVSETKNLVAEQTGLLKVPQKRDFDIQGLKGAVVEFLFWLQKEGRAKATLDPYGYSLKFLIKNHANLFDPESVKKVVAVLDKTKARKYNLIKAYRAFLNAYGIKAVLPKYTPDRKLPYLPPEEHMDLLIASCNQEMAAFLQATKETAARPCEVLRILPDELDFVNKKIPINHPAKGCNPRVLDMSDKLCEMLRSLPKDDRKKVFAYKNSSSAGKTFRVMRKRAIRKLGIPELRKIHIYTFRYWRATVEFQRYQTEVAVMVLLGHKSTRYLWLYVQLAKIHFGGAREYVCLKVHDEQQERKAIEQGFEYVRTDKDGGSYYRKPK
jgi:integrase/transposase-like protein